MENEINLSRFQDKKESLINNKKIHYNTKQLELEENKINNNSSNYLFDKIGFQHRYNLLLHSRKNKKLAPIIQNFYKDKEHSSCDKNKKIILKPIKKISTTKNNDAIKNLSLLSDNQFNINTLKNKEKKFFINSRNLFRNESTPLILNKTDRLLPLIKPRKIIINIFSGPYEFKITDINKKYLNFKKFGRNSVFMGERYNPDNYGLDAKTMNHRNYYGGIFAN